MYRPTGPGVARHTVCAAPVPARPRAHDRRPLGVACGIGGVTTVFTLVDAVVLRPLPVAAPEELVWLRDPSFSYPMFEQIRDRGHMLRGVFAWERAHAAHGRGRASRADVDAARDRRVSRHARPSTGAGRLLNQADVGNTAADAQAVAVLSYAAWQRHFNGDPAAIGRTLRIEGQPFTIVGVTPARLLRRRGRDVAGRDHPGDDAAAPPQR